MITINNESGLPNAKNASVTGSTGTMINDPRAEVLGSLMVAATAEKKVFQKKKPLIDNSNNCTTNRGLDNDTGRLQLLPRKDETITKMTDVSE